MPSHSGRVDARRWISLLATAIASRTRSATGPVSRSSRSRSMHSATSAALPPAACPPTPSMTMNRPRASSTWKRSSLTSRWRPASVAPAAAIVSSVGICREFSSARVLNSHTCPADHGDERGEEHVARDEQERHCASPRSELEIDRFGEADARLIRQRRLDAVLALRAVHLVVAARHVTAVQRGAERAEIDQEESSRSADRGEFSRARARRRPTRRS